MRLGVRKSFPYVALLLLAAAVAYAVTFGRLPPADFTFINGTDIKGIDPALVTGQPEGIIVNALFEGLLRQDPKTLEPIEGLAERWELSDDKKTYTFHIRDDARWTDGTPITAHDVAWSWQRFLHPEIPAEYAYQLTSYVVGAAKYNSAEVEPGDRVEVELAPRKNDMWVFPRGEILKGVLRKIDKPPAPELPDDATDDEQKDATAAWQTEWVFTVEIDGQNRRFSREESPPEGVTPAEQVLVDFDEVGIRALDDQTLEVSLINATPYFTYLMAFYPLYPVPRACVEKYGLSWTKPENIVSSGPFQLEFRRIRDRIRMVKNPLYWNADEVEFEIVDALAITSQTTQLNLFESGRVHWATDVPPTVMAELLEREEFISEPMLTVYYYLINTTRKPLDDVRVRRALNMSINKQEICDKILGAGQKPARSIVPPGIHGYKQALCGEYDIEAARELLAEAGYPDGKGMPKIEILYNDQDTHKKIAEKIQHDWNKYLGVRCDLRGLEWGTYLDTRNQLDFDVARAGWIGDYPDPNTFLDMFLTDGANNNTGFSDPKYDDLILNRAPAESDPERRMAMLHEAEQMLLDDLPIIPIYFYVSLNMVRPEVQNFHANIQDVHPIHMMRLAPEETQTPPDRTTRDDATQDRKP